MSKADRAKKRALRKAVKLAGMPEVAAVPRREANGRKQRETREGVGAERDPTKTALNARAKHMGEGQTREGRAKVAAQSYAGEAGRAIMASQQGEPARGMTECYTALLRADAAYCSRYLGSRRHAKTAKIEMMPERFEARADDTPDLRTDEERDRQAVSTWMRWQGWLGQIAKHKASAIQRALGEEAELVTCGGVLTGEGCLFIEAMTDLVPIWKENA